MEDPTRIDSVLALVRDAWEGQPELPLATLFGILANQGIGWGTDDADLVAALQEMIAVCPPRLPLIDAHVAHRWVVVCENPTLRVTLGRDAGDTPRVIVRRWDVHGRMLQPAIWPYTAVRPTGPGRPLVIADGSGVEHRLGIVSRLIRQRDAAEPVRLAGLRRGDLGDDVYVLTCDSDEGLRTAVLDHRAHVFTKLSRAVERTEFAWDEVVSAAPGGPMVLSLPGGRRADLGRVTECYLSEGRVFGP